MERSKAFPIIPGDLVMPRTDKPMTVGDLRRIIEMMDDDWIVYSMNPVVGAARNGHGLYLTDSEAVASVITDAVCRNGSAATVFP